MMQVVPLRKLVSAIGLAVAIAVSVATPTVYFIHDYVNASAKMTFKARLNAARVAQYIYTHGGIWQYQQLRLAANSPFAKKYTISPIVSCSTTARHWPLQL